MHTFTLSIHAPRSIIRCAILTHTTSLHIRRDPFGFVRRELAAGDDGKPRKATVFWLLTRPSFWILDPKLAREVLAPKFTIQDSDRDIAKVFPIWGRLFGQGLFMVSGDQWKRQHRIAARSFGSSNTRGFLPTVREVATRHVDRLWEPSQGQVTGGDTTTTIIAPTDAFAPMALEVICSIAFGLEDQKVLTRVTELTRVVSDVMSEKGGHLVMSYVFLLPFCFNSDSLSSIVLSTREQFAF